MAFFISTLTISHHKGVHKGWESRTKTSIDTRSNTLCKTLIESFAPRHFTKFFFFLRRELNTEGIRASGPSC